MFEIVIFGHNSEWLYGKLLVFDENRAHEIAQWLLPHFTHHKDPTILRDMEVGEDGQEIPYYHIKEDDDLRITIRQISTRQ